MGGPPHAALNRSLTSEMVRYTASRYARYTPRSVRDGTMNARNRTRLHRSGRISSKRPKAIKPTCWFLLGSSRSTRMRFISRISGASRACAAATSGVRIDAGRVGAHAHLASIGKAHRAARHVHGDVEELGTAGQERMHVHACLESNYVGAEHAAQDRLAPRLGNQAQHRWIGKRDV